MWVTTRLDREGSSASETAGQKGPCAHRHIPPLRGWLGAVWVRGAKKAADCRRGSRPVTWQLRAERAEGPEPLASSLAFPHKLNLFSEHPACRKERWPGSVRALQSPSGDQRFFSY